jgi:hypothetical protein
MFSEVKNICFEGVERDAPEDNSLESPPPSADAGCFIGSDCA